MRSALQEAIGTAGKSYDHRSLRATGVYLGCMYTEYLDTVLGPQASTAYTKTPLAI